MLEYSIGGGQVWGDIIAKCHTFVGLAPFSQTQFIFLWRFAIKSTREKGTKKREKRTIGDYYFYNIAEQNV